MAAQARGFGLRNSVDARHVAKDSRIGGGMEGGDDFILQVAEPGQRSQYHSRCQTREYDLHQGNNIRVDTTEVRQ